MLPEDGSRFRTTNMEFFDENLENVVTETKKNCTRPHFKKKSPFYSYVEASFNQGVYTQPQFD